MTEAEKNEKIKAVEEQIAKLQKELEDIRNIEVQKWDFSAWDNYPTMLMREYACRIPVESGFTDQFTTKLAVLTNLTRFKYCYDKDYVPDWSNEDEHKWYVCFRPTTGKYMVDWVTRNCLPTVLYFSSKEVAQQYADWLNTGCPKK